MIRPQKEGQSTPLQYKTTLHQLNPCKMIGRSYKVRLVLDAMLLHNERKPSSISMDESRLSFSFLKLQVKLLVSERLPGGLLLLVI